MDAAAKKPWSLISGALQPLCGHQPQQNREQLAAASTGESLAVQDKIGHWTAYRAFNEHALTEIARGELDDWFT